MNSIIINTARKISNTSEINGVKASALKEQRKKSRTSPKGGHSEKKETKKSKQNKISRKANFIKKFFALTAMIMTAFTSGCGGAVAVGSSKPIYSIVLDAGHGGIDGGVKGISGSIEADINLEMAFSLKKSFESAGFKVVMTRNSQAGLYGVYTAGFKKRDMNKRREIIEKAKPHLVISVHMNSFPGDKTRRGAQVFYKTGSDESKNLSNVIQKRLNKMEESTRECINLSGDFYMLNCTDYTSVLIECGFLSNAEDERLLLTEDYRDKFSQVVTMAVVEYYATLSV